MESQQLITLIGNLGGVALFAWFVLRLLERSMNKIERSQERQAEAEEESAKSLGAISAELSALRAHMMGVADAVADLTPPVGHRRSRVDKKE